MARTNPKRVTAEDAWERARSGAVIVDVRSRDELASGTPKGAIHIPFETLDRRWEGLGSAEVLVICRSGDRSRRGAALLRRHGLAAAEVKGGMRAWEKAGLPTTTPKKAKRR